MAQFDVYANPNPKSRERVPYLLDIQAEILESLTSRLVVPLVYASKPIKILNPAFEIEGKAVVMSTQEMAGVPLGALGKKIGSLANRRSEILGAVDFLVTGF